MKKRTQNKAETPAIHFNERVDDDFPIHIMRNYLETKAPPIHTHDQFEIGYCVSGNGIFFVRDKIYPFKGGDISVIFPGERHIAQTIAAEKTIWYFLSIDMDKMYSFDMMHTSELYHRFISNPANHGGIFRGGENPEIEEIIKTLVDEILEKPVEYVYMCRVLLSKLILLMTRSPLNEGEKSAAEMSGEPIMPAILYIISHYDTDVQASELAEMCHLSEGHMRRLFVSALGYSPLEYLHRIRINYACALLHSDSGQSVCSIAEEVGYTTLSSFYRRFKKYVGCMPGEYEKKRN